MKILVIGSGGREHCLVWKLAQSPLVDKIYCAPGNGGTAQIAQNVDISSEEIWRLVNFATEENIALTVVGPESPLAAGIVDRFEENGLKVFGPRRDLALLEGSKVFAKEQMRKYGIPTAEFEIFDNPEKAKEYIKSKGAPLVVKADGLAGGKGVIVCRAREEAFGALDLIMVDKIFGDAGKRIVVEDCLDGEEASILIFTDGETIIPMVPSQDHKRINDGDKGPNTGGMGAYAPAPVVNDQLLKKIIDRVFRPLIEGMKAEGRVYKGILYGGLMIKDGEPMVLEYNVRFGDPELQAVLPKLKSDLVDIMLKTIDNKLSECELDWDNRACLCVVLASGGYPGTYEKEKEITGLDKLEGREDIWAFHAGTRLISTSTEGNKFLTTGGRVLNIVGLADTIKEAQQKVYEAIKSIHFDKMYYRKDIGYKALKSICDDVSAKIIPSNASLEEKTG
jgi:phosphoribosylamine--glycine ligase